MNAVSRSTIGTQCEVLNIEYFLCLLLVIKYYNFGLLSDAECLTNVLPLTILRSRS